MGKKPKGTHYGMNDQFPREFLNGSKVLFQIRKQYERRKTSSSGSRQTVYRRPDVPWQEHHSPSLLIAYISPPILFSTQAYFSFCFFFFFMFASFSVCHVFVLLSLVLFCSLLLLLIDAWNQTTRLTQTYNLPHTTSLHQHRSRYSHKQILRTLLHISTIYAITWIRRQHLKSY